MDPVTLARGRVTVDPWPAGGQRQEWDLGGTRIQSHAKMNSANGVLFLVFSSFLSFQKIHLLRLTEIIATKYLFYFDFTIECPINFKTQFSLTPMIVERNLNLRRIQSISRKKIWGLRLLLMGIVKSLREGPIPLKERTGIQPLRVRLPSCEFSHTWMWVRSQLRRSEVAVP